MGRGACRRASSSGGRPRGACAGRPETWPRSTRRSRTIHTLESHRVGRPGNTHETGPCPASIRAEGGVGAGSPGVGMLGSRPPSRAKPVRIAAQRPPGARSARGPDCRDGARSVVDQTRVGTRGCRGTPSRWRGHGPRVSAARQSGEISAPRLWASRRADEESVPGGKVPLREREKALCRNGSQNSPRMEQKRHNEYKDVPLLAKIVCPDAPGLARSRGMNEISGDQLGDQSRARWGRPAPGVSTSAEAAHETHDRNR